MVVRHPRALAIALLLAACSGKITSGGSSTGDHRGTQTAPDASPAANGSTNVSVLIAKVLPGGGIPAVGTPAAGTAAVTPAAAAPQVVDVGLTEFAIAMPNALPAGPTRFSIHNNGTAPHSFVIEGQGIEKKLANNLQPGQSAFLNVDLAPGTYTIYCPVGEGAHRAKGMEVQVTVT